MAMNDRVAELHLFHSKSPYAKHTCSILPNDDFNIGRRFIQTCWEVNEPTISTHHLKFRCVVYEDDTDEKIAPMIYVRVLSSNSVQITRTGMSSNTNGGHTVSRSDPDVLLSHGDTLHLTSDVSIVFRAMGDFASRQNARDSIISSERRRFRSQFHVTGRKLGAGGNASVFVAVKQRTKRQVACKIVPIPSVESAALETARPDDDQQHPDWESIEKQRVLKKREDLAREYTILKDLNHPNIITLEKVICATYNVYIFQELITGGDLLSYLDQKGALNEAQSVVIVRQILKAVEYLHDNGVVHRDVKPENILMTSWRDGARIVLTDFGQARATEVENTVVNSSAVFRMRSVVGTYGYTAPEIIKQLKGSLEEQGYSKAVDIFSIGCITATLLTNGMLFPDQGAEFQAAKMADLGSPAVSISSDLSIMDEWISVGRKAKSFIRECVVQDEIQRLTAKQALQHQWLTNKYYAADIEAAYERAIEDWTPRKKIGNLIDFIDTKDAASPPSTPDFVRRVTQEVKSQYFESSLPLPPANVFMRKKVELKLPYTRASIPEETVQDDVEVPNSPILGPRDGTAPNSFDNLHKPSPFHYPGPIDTLTQCRGTLDDMPPPAKKLCH